MELASSNVVGRGRKDCTIAENTYRSLVWFNSRDAVTCDACCKTAVDFLRSGVNAKLCATAATRLNTSTAELRTAIEALMRLMSNACRDSVQTEQMRAALEQRAVNRSLIDAVCLHIDDVRSLLESTFSRMIPRHLPVYRSIDWRFGVQISTRCVYDIVDPMVTLRLSTSDGVTNDAFLFRIDAVTLRHVISELETILTAVRSSEYRNLAVRL
jgi:hypothetical protein